MMMMMIKGNKPDKATPGRHPKRKINELATEDKRGRRPVQPEPLAASRYDHVVIGLCLKKRREEDAEIAKVAIHPYFAANVQYAFA